MSTDQQAAQASEPTLKPEQVVEAFNRHFPRTKLSQAWIGFAADLWTLGVLAERAALAAQQAPDGRGTDEQIIKERDIARHAIVGALAAGYAGATHPGADHWLAAAHDAGVKIKALEAAQQAAEPVCEVATVYDPRTCFVTHLTHYVKPGTKLYAGHAPATPQATNTISKREAIRLVNGLIDGDTLPESSLALLRDLFSTPQAKPVGMHKLIAGALFDFAGHLTTRPIPVTLGSACLASPAVELLRDWAALRGLSLDDADVMSWHKATTPPPVQPKEGGAK